jgi:hypothetical protein
VEPGWCAKIFDIQFYRGVIDKDCREISYAFPTGNLQKKPVKPSNPLAQKSGRLKNPA